jgi:hypothetical protein
MTIEISPPCLHLRRTHRWAAGQGELEIRI